MQAESESLRVLVVDDEPFTLKALRRILRIHDVTLVSGGAEALHLLDAGEVYDVIVCDVMMPDLSGVDVHREIQARHPGMEQRMLFITGGALGSGVVESIEQLPNPLLPKPFDHDELLAAVARMGARSRAGQE